MLLWFWKLSLNIFEYSKICSLDSARMELKLDDEQSGTWQIEVGGNSGGLIWKRVLRWIFPNIGSCSVDFRKNVEVRRTNQGSMNHFAAETLHKRDPTQTFRLHS